MTGIFKRFMSLVRKRNNWANAHLVSALGHLNRIDEARAAVDELLKRKPEFSCSYARKHLFYIKSSAQIEYYLEGLSKAEMPE